jgi:predicted enzyme related to lactoylglutathione lyase
MADASIRGRFVWHELMSDDPDAAAAFFGKVFGWKTQPFAGNPGYRMFMQGKQGAGGLMQLPDEAKAHGTPPVWVIYIATPDVDETAAQAAALGGTVLRAPEDIPTVGRFAILADPQGAMFAAFTPAPRQAGGELLDPYSWHELVTSDLQKGFAFYQRLFGWSEAGAIDMGPMGLYQMFGFGGVPMGGMMRKPAESPGPPAWLGYVQVDDVRKTAAKITAAGGTIVYGPAEVPGGDMIVNGIDAEGVVFAAHSRKPAAKAAPAKKSAKPKKTSAAKKKAAPKKKSATPKKKAAPKKKATPKRKASAAKKKGVSSRTAKKKSRTAKKKAGARKKR